MSSLSLHILSAPIMLGLSISLSIAAIPTEQVWKQYFVRDDESILN